MVIQPRRYHQIVALSRPAAEIGIQRTNDVGNLLQIHRIACTWSDVGAGYGQRSLGRWKRRPIWDSKVRGQKPGLRTSKRLVDPGDRIVPQFLLVIDEEPQAERSDLRDQ